MSRFNKIDHDFYGAYIGNVNGYSNNLNYCLNYVLIDDSIDYICLYGEKENYSKTPNTCLAYYVFDKYFEGVDGLYNSIIYKQKERLEEYKQFFSQFRYVISIDYSTYMSMGKNVIINQIAKSRIVCAWINNNVPGCTCIPNITFSLEEYDDICLEGIVEGSSVAISLVSCLNNKEMRYRLDTIIKKVVDIIKPKNILVYTESVKTDIYQVFKYAIDNQIQLIIPSNKMKARNEFLLEKKYGKR